MTRGELFPVFPRPWRLSEEEVGVVLCASGIEALIVSGDGDREIDDVVGIAEMIVGLVNEAEV